MRQFYKVSQKWQTLSAKLNWSHYCEILWFDDKKVSPLVTQLTWTHYLVLLSIKDSNAINYYIEQIEKRNLSKRQLEEIIKNKEYERLPIEAKNKLINSETLKVKDLVPNPILIKNKS